VSTNFRSGRPEAARTVWDWRPVEEPRHDTGLRRTGLLRGVFALVVAAVFSLFAHLLVVVIVGVIGLATLLLALLSPQRGYRALHRFGDRLGLWVGTLIGFVLMPLLFFLVVTPLALVFRLQGRDSLQRRHADTSYWTTRDDGSRDASFYRRQY